MLKQISILPSGCQINKKLSRLLLFFNEKYLIYASSLAIYVINSNTYIIEKILSFDYKAITSFSICSKNNNLLTVCTLDHYIYLSNIEDETIINKFQLQNTTDVLWEPHSSIQCGIITMDNYIKLYEWDTTRLEKVLEILVVKNNLLKYSMARWNANLDGQIAIGCTNNMIILFSKVTKKQSILPSPEDINTLTNQIVDMQWDRLSPNYLLVAYQNFLSLWDAEQGTLIHKYELQSLQITSIAWLDWTAGSFVTSNNKNTNLKLWNASQKAPLDNIRFTYNTSNSESNGIHNMFFCSGKKRVLCSNTCGSISVLNIHTLQVEYVSSEGHNETIFDCVLSPACPDKFCTASYDSSIKIWSIHNLLSEKTLNSNEHVIVYSCDWSPRSDMIVGSCSTGVIHIWEVESGRELTRYSHHNKQSYSVVWNKNAENLIASTSADCTLVVFYVDLNDLNENQSSLLRSNSYSKRKSVKTDKNSFTETEIKYKYQHPAIVYGCSWNITHANVLASTCHDGIVRVFNILYGLLYVLKGHPKRCFGVSWSYTIPNVLASSSDDLCVNVWEVNLTMNISDLSNPNIMNLTRNDSNVPSLLPIKILKGHTNNVRALCWNYELKYLLLSGSWDSTIKLWDINTDQCLSTIIDHFADIYSITSHPERPFTYISTSRDTTIRIWELTDFVTLNKYKSIYDKSLHRSMIWVDNEIDNNDGVIAVPEQLLSTNYNNDNQLLHGKYSKLLNNKLIKFDKNDKINKIELATNYYQLYSFYNGASDSMELWENILSILNVLDVSTSEHIHTSNFNSLSIHKQLRNIKYRKINNENEIIELVRSEARKLESHQKNTRKMDLSSKVEEHLRNAAMLYACTGDFLKYCQLMIDIGDWTAALAMAPSVSYDYWKELTQKYGDILLNKSSDKCIPYLLGIGKDADAIEFYLQRQETEKSMMIAKMSEIRTDLIPEYKITEASNNSNLSNLKIKNSISLHYSNNNSKDDNTSMIKIRDRTTKEIDDSRIIINIVCNYSIKVYREQGRPILAATQYLAIGEIKNAIQILCDNDIYDMAYAVALCFDYDTTNIIIELANHCAKLHDIDFAVELLQNIPNKDEEIGLLISKYFNNEEVIEISNKYNLKSFNDWESKSKEEIVIGSDTEAVICNVITMNYNQAIHIGLSVLKKFARHSLDLSISTKKLIHALKYIKAIDINDNNIRNEFLCSMLWFTAHEALSVGMLETGYYMLNTSYNYCIKNQISILLLSENDLRMQCLCFNIVSGNRSVITFLASTIQYYSLQHNITSKEDDDQTNNITIIIELLTELVQYIRNAPEETSYKSTLSSFSLKKYFIKQQLMDDGIWGEKTENILRIVQKICDFLKLPNIGSYILKKEIKMKELSHIKTSLYEKHANSIVHGSLLPSSHIAQKNLTSFISDKRIKGKTIILKGCNNNNNNNYCSINEIINWERNNPFSPVMDGSFVNY